MSPPSPTQTAERDAAAPRGQAPVGSVQVPRTLEYDTACAFTAYPDQRGLSCTFVPPDAAAGPPTAVQSPAARASTAPNRLALRDTCIEDQIAARSARRLPIEQP